MKIEIAEKCSEGSNMLFYEQVNVDVQSTNERSLIQGY